MLFFFKFFFFLEKKILKKKFFWIFRSFFEKKKYEIKFIRGKCKPYIEIFIDKKILDNSRLFFFTFSKEKN